MENSADLGNSVGSLQGPWYKETKQDRLGMRCGEPVRGATVGIPTSDPTTSSATNTKHSGQMSGQWRWNKKWKKSSQESSNMKGEKREERISCGHGLAWTMGKPNQREPVFKTLPRLQDQRLCFVFLISDRGSLTVEHKKLLGEVVML